jgi:hypothetical protein
VPSGKISIDKAVWEYSTH